MNKSKCRKKAEKSEPAKPAVAKEEVKPLVSSCSNRKVAAKPQSRNFKAVKPVLKSRQNDASKIRAQ